MFKKNFASWLSYQPISSKPVYSSNYSICVSEQDILDHGFSDIAARLLNEEKAIMDSGYLYIDPYYMIYEKGNPINHKGKLLQNVKSASFQALIAQCEFQCLNTDDFRGIFYRISQKDLRRFGCTQTIAQLLRKKLAFISPRDTDIYLDINFINSLETTSKIPSSLSGFHILLGEGNTLKNVLDLLDECRLNHLSDGKNYITVSQETVKDYGLQTQFFSLADLGIAVINNNDEYVLTPEFSSWILDYTEHAGDRMAFMELYEGLV